MPEWRDKGIVLSVRKYGEKGMIANILTLEHGRHLGWISNSINKKNSFHAQPGNLVDVFWKSRLIEQMGNFKIELISSVVGKLFDDKIKLQAIISLCTLLEKVLPERQNYSEVFNATEAFINLLLVDNDISNNAWVEGYVKWEIGVLAAIGFSLKLDKCAVTGQKNNLYFVSPKTGKAVTKEGAGKFAPKLLLLPFFLGGAEIIGSNFNKDIIAGLKITSYFFKNKLLLSINDNENNFIPNARNRLIEMIEKF
ncbi:DNA repair protein RecO [Alphaproteobacteria bacterium]|nr:DNA repair protein RecO [Alphaproteobacteria bacterium]